MRVCFSATWANPEMTGTRKSNIVYVNLFNRTIFLLKVLVSQNGCKISNTKCNRKTFN